MQYAQMAVRCCMRASMTPHVMSALHAFLILLLMRLACMLHAVLDRPNKLSVDSH